MAQIWTSACTAVKARERRWGPLGLIPTEPQCNTWRAWLCRVQCCGQGVADSHPVGSILPLSLWGKLFSNPPTGNIRAVGKKGYSEKKICAIWHFGSTHCLSLLHNVSRGQRVQLCWVDNCLSVLLPLSQQHLWAQRTEEAGSAVALGERRPRDRDMTAKSSCVLALPGSRCPCRGWEWAGKPPIHRSRACQAACYAGAICRCASLALTLLAMSRASSPCPWFGAIWVCVAIDCGAQLEHVAWRRTRV